MLLLYFAASTLITRLLGDVGRGEYALLTNQVAFLSMLVSLNLGFGITYFTAQSPSSIRTIAGTASTLFLSNLVLVPLILWGLAMSDRIVDLVMPPGRTQFLYWAFLWLSIMLSLVNTAVAAILLGLKQFKLLNWMGICNAGLSLVGFLLFYLFRERFATADVLPMVLIISAVTMVIQTTIWVILYIRYVGVPPVPVGDRTTLKTIFGFSLIGHLSNLINLINYRFDVWVVSEYHGAAALGLYSVAVGMAQLLFYIPDPFSRVVQPYLFGQVKDEMLVQYKTVARLNFTAVLTLALVMAITAHWAVPMLFGEVFSTSVFALYLLLPGILFSSTTKLLTPLLVQGGLQRINLFSISLAAVITIVLDLLLIPDLGIKGAAIATSISYLTILLVTLFAIRYRMGIAINDLFLLRKEDIVRSRTLLGEARSAPPLPSGAPASLERVLCVVGWWPSGKDVNGVFIKEHVLAIARHRPVDVLHMEIVKARRPWPVFQVVTRIEDGLTVHRIRISTPIRRFYLADRLARHRYAKFISAHHGTGPFDLIHLHVLTDLTKEVLPIAAKLRIPVVLTEHNTFYHLGIRSLPPAESAKHQETIRQSLADPMIKAIMPVSKDLARILHQDFGAPLDKIHVVPNIAADDFVPGPPPGSAPFRIMLAAIWRPPKDHDVFIKALRLLPVEKLRGCRIDWVGHGPDHARIRERCRLELPEVDIAFPGNLDRASMANLMRRAHLFVLPTKAENLPCVVLESLCCGTPVVSMTVNGVPELIDGTNGTLVPPSDPVALANALLACMENPDRFDRAHIARSAIARFSAELVSQQIMEVYRTVR